MKSLVKNLVVVLVFLELPSHAAAQTVAELKASIDSLRAEVVQLRASMASRLPPDGRTVQEYVSSAIAAAGTGSAVGNVVNGDLTVSGRVCLPTCRSDVPAAIQIRAQKDAEIELESNLDGTNSQDSASHVSMLSLASDGGLRLIHNYLHARNPDGSWKAVWGEAKKPRTIFGFDSQGTPSMSQDKNGYIYPSQSLIISFDDARKVIWLQSMKAGWKWGFCASPRVDSNCESSYYPVPTP